MYVPTSFQQRDFTGANAVSGELRASTKKLEESRPAPPVVTIIRRLSGNVMTPKAPAGSVVVCGAEQEDAPTPARVTRAAIICARGHSFK
jgi:hypothetical protein